MNLLRRAVQIFAGAFISIVCMWILLSPLLGTIIVTGLAVAAWKTKYPDADFELFGIGLIAFAIQVLLCMETMRLTDYIFHK